MIGLQEIQNLLDLDGHMELTGTREAKLFWLLRRYCIPGAIMILVDHPIKGRVIEIDSDSGADVSVAVGGGGGATKVVKVPANIHNKGLVLPRRKGGNIQHHLLRLSSVKQGGSG